MPCEQEVAGQYSTAVSLSPSSFFFCRTTRGEEADKHVKKNSTQVPAFVSTMMPTKLRAVEPGYIKLQGDREIDISIIQNIKYIYPDNSAYPRELSKIVTSNSLPICSSRHGKFEP